MAIKDMFREARKLEEGLVRSFGDDLSRRALFRDPEKPTIQQAPTALVMSKAELAELRGEPLPGERYYESSASDKTSRMESLYLDFIQKMGTSLNPSKLSSGQITDLYMEVTPRENIIPSDNSIEPTPFLMPDPTPIPAYSETELNLLRRRTMEAYTGKQESEPILLLSPEERLVILGLRDNEKGSQKVTWAIASPNLNGVSMRESFTEQPLFDVMSPDGSPIDLNRLEEYPISNLSDVMSRLTLLSSREVQDSNVKQEKFK